MSQLTDFYSLLSVSSSLTEATLYICCQSIKLNNITMQKGCITLSEHVTFGRMQITLRHTKTGATVFEYDQLFSAGLLLSAVVAFYLPFTQFTCQNGLVWRSGPICWRSMRTACRGGSLTRPMELLQSCTAVVNGGTQRASFSDKLVSLCVASLECLIHKHLQSSHLHRQHTSTITSTSAGKWSMVALIHTHSTLHTHTHAKRCLPASECFAGVAIKGYQREAVSAESQAGGCSEME